MVIAVVLDADSSSPSTNLIPLFKHELQNYFDFNLRMLAVDIEQNKKVRAIPILHSLPNHNTVIKKDLIAIVEKILRRQDEFSEKVQLLDEKDQAIALNAFKCFLVFSAKLLNDQRDNVNNTESEGSDVINVILTAMPFPDESVPFEKIIDFKLDEKTKTYIVNLQKWIRTVIKEKYSPAELKEELEFLINSYNDHMRFHKLKIQTSVIETLISVPLHIAEHVVKIKWGEIAKELFLLKKYKIDLLEAERSAPGREIAYIIKAKHEFGK